MNTQLLSFVTVVLTASTLNASPPPSTQSLQNTVAFEPNVGQARSDAQYVATGRGYSVDLSKSGSRLHIRNSKGSAEMSFRLVGSNPDAAWQTEGRLAGYANYFHGRDASSWKTGVPTFARVRRSGIYPGVDLVYYGSHNQLEYDFVVSPGADPAAIRVRIEGADTLKTDGGGNLILHTEYGDVMHHRPLVYQTRSGVRREVAGQFAISGKDVTFQLGAYDRSEPLIIDPVLSYSSYLGGAGAEQGNSIAVDGTGNVYVAGYTTSTAKGDYNILVRKFAPNGAQTFSADIGGAGDDYGNAIQVGTDGTIYVAGQTNSTDLPVVNAAQDRNGGGNDAFSMRINANGQGLIFSTYLGGGAEDMAHAIALDAQGAAYVAGTSSSSDFPITSGVLQTTGRGGKDAFLVKLTAQGVKTYATLLGGGSDDEAEGVAVDSSGNAYLTGSTESDSFPQINNPFQHSRHGGVDAFAAELNPSGANLIYSTFLGGIGGDVGYGIAVDSQGSAYIAGKTGSLDFPTTSGSYDTGYNGGDNDIFVAKLTSGQAGIVYSTVIGSRGNDEGFGIAVNAAGEAYVVGNSDSDQYPVTPDALQGSRKGNRDATVAKLDANGAKLLFSTYLGGGLNDVGYGIALDSASNVYITGITSSTDFPIAGTNSQTQPGGNSDAFVASIIFSAVVAPPSVSTNGVVNPGNYAIAPVAPGSVIAIFGSNFTGTAAPATALPLPATLGGVSVTINGVAAPLFYAGLNQINAQVPAATVPGSATLLVTNAAGTSSPSSFTVAPTAPYLIVSSGRAVVVNQDGTLNTANNPAHGGSTVTAYFVGIGPVNATVADGAASPAATSTQAYSAKVGNAPATVTYMGLSPGSVALGQANIQIPASPGSGDLPLLITIGGIDSNSASLTVAP